MKHKNSIGFKNIADFAFIKIIEIKKLLILALSNHQRQKFVKNKLFVKTSFVKSRKNQFQQISQNKNKVALKMKSLNYNSILTYTYSKCEEEMKRILEIDGFNCFKLNDDLKIVEYSINHSKSIQLSQLLYLQDIKLIRFTIAQQIQLCLDIYLKYYCLQQQNIQHNYLSFDRIWLNILDNHQITIMPENLKYSIHFVGYDCPFYENDNYFNSKRNDNQEIKYIIIYVLNLIKERQLKKKKTSQNQNQKVQLQDIFKSLLDKGIHISFEHFHQESIQIFERYKCKNQRLNDAVDKEQTYINSKRARRITDIIKNIELILKCHYKDGQSYQFQQILYSIFPIIAKELKKATFYENQKLPKNETYIDLEQQIIEIDNKVIDQIINENKEPIMKDFKFQYDLQSIKEIILLELPNQFKFLKYFLNHPKFENQTFNGVLIQIQKIKKEILVKVVIQTLTDNLELQILKLIDELI